MRLQWTFAGTSRLAPWQPERCQYKWRMLGITVRSCSSRKHIRTSLFNMFVNNIVKISSIAKCVMYKDNTSIFSSGDNCEDSAKNVNATLAHLGTSAKQSRLKTNTEKTTLFYFASLTVQEH